MATNVGDVGETRMPLPEYDESAPTPWLHEATSVAQVTQNPFIPHKDQQTDYWRESDVVRNDPNAGLIRATNQEWHATWAATEWQRQQAVARVAELEAEISALKQGQARIAERDASLVKAARRRV